MIPGTTEIHAAQIEPPADTLASALRIVVRTYPDGGNQLEAAVRLAFTLGWDASHHVHQLQEKTDA